MNSCERKRGETKSQTEKQRHRKKTEQKGRNKREELLAQHSDKEQRDLPVGSLPGRWAPG
jgi:hypothetical protein